MYEMVRSSRFCGDRAHSKENLEDTIGGPSFAEHLLNNRLQMRACWCD